MIQNQIQRYKKARVKLVYPAQIFTKNETPRPDGSLGLLYLAGILREHGIDVSVLDMCVGEEGDDLKDTFLNRKRIDENYFRVGISQEMLRKKLHGYNIIGVSANYTSQTHNAFEAAAVSKRLNPNILTVAGGWNATALYPSFLNNGFDAVVIGEGETTMLEIVQNFEKGLGYEHIQNVAYKDQNGRIVVNPKRPALTNLDLLPIPAWDLLPLRRYWQISKPQSWTISDSRKCAYLCMQTSRGCQFRCKFCHNSKAGDAAFLRFKSYDRIITELDIIKKLGASYVFFNDDNLLARRGRIKELLKGLKGRGLKFCDHNGVSLCQLFHHAKDGNFGIDLELLDLMKKGGFYEIAIAFESGSQRILDKYASKKWNHRRHDIFRLIKAINRKGIRVIGYFTIGYPDETLDELTETFIMARDLVKAGLNSVVFSIVVPLPGTALYDMAMKNGNLLSGACLEKYKESIPQMVNTVIPPEILSYTRRLVYSLFTPSPR